MDLTLPVSYRGLILNAADTPAPGAAVAGIRLTRAKFSEVGVHGYVEKKSLSDGMDASDVYMGQRSVAMAGEVYAQDKGDLFDFLDQLRLKFTPTDAYNEDPDKRGFLPLYFQVQTKYTTYWATGIVDRMLFCRPSRQPDFAISIESIGGRESDGYVVPFSVDLIAKDPRFYYIGSSDTNLSGTSGSGTLTNRGNYPTALNFILEPSTTAEATFNFSGVGSNFDVTLPAGVAGRLVRVDSVNKVVTLTENDVETLRMDLITFNAGTTWPQVPAIPEGESAAGYNWSSTVALSATLSRMFFNEAWA